MSPQRNVSASARCIVYTRVSTAKQASAEKASLDDQLRRCQELAASHGHSSLAVWDDPGRSGTDPQRLEELVAWCEAHPRRDGLVVVYSPDRFARIGSEVVGYYTVRLRKAGWDLQYVDMRRTGVQMVDGVTGALRAEIAAEESRIKRERSLVGGRGQAARGRWNGGPAPYGYRVDPETKRLVAGEAADQKKVRAAFKAYVDGATLEEVAQALGRHPRTGKAWNQSGARALLLNPAYVGTLEWGRRKGSNGRGSMEGAHEALVDVKLWRRAQDRLRARGAAFAHGARRAPPDGALPYILSGVVRCSCGRKMVGGGGIPKDATEAERLKWRRYQCKACRGSVPQAALESALFGAVASFFREADEDGRLEKRMRAWVGKRVAAGGAEAQAALREDLERRKARLVRLAEETDDSDVAARLREVGAELKALAAESAGRPDARTLKAQAARWLETVRKAFQWKREPDAATVNRELAALRPIILEAIWDRDERTVEVNLRPFKETGLAAVPKAARARHSGYSGPWRAQASRPAARPRT